MKAEEIRLHFQKLNEQKFEFASVDRFRSDYLKLKTVNPAIYSEKISAVRKELLKGVEDAGNFSDRIKLVLTGLRELGLTDEAKPFESLKMDVDNDFKELVSINDRIKSF